jgi:hypothetical protein
MNMVFKCCLVALAAVALTAARAGEQPRSILNLQEISPSGLSVIGNRVRLMVNGQPPQILAFTNRPASHLAHRVEPDSQSVRVTYGADLVGFARVEVRQTEAELILVSLDFETAEQAVAAGKALRYRDAAPSPLRKEKAAK